MRHDIKITSDYINAQNDIEIYESDIDHISDTIEANVGEYKEHPNDGVGITSYLSSQGQEQIISRKIILQLSSDTYKVNNPKVMTDSNGKLVIDPKATIII